jgi:hypothetical protein
MGDATLDRNDCGHIPVVRARILQASPHRGGQVTRYVEMIFVDGGAQHGSLDQAVSLLVNDPRTRVIQLSRNFGHHKAAQQLRSVSWSGSCATGACR